MTVIQERDLIDSVADALQFISYYHPLDFIQAVHRAWEREQNPAAKDAMAQILINSRMWSSLSTNCSFRPATYTIPFLSS